MPSVLRVRPPLELRSPVGPYGDDRQLQESRLERGPEPEDRPDSRQAFADLRCVEPRVERPDEATVRADEFVKVKDKLKDHSGCP
jgi:hypothetical protein